MTGTETCQLSGESIRRLWIVMDSLGQVTNETGLVLEAGPPDPKQFVDDLIDNLYAIYAYLGRTLDEAGLWDTQPSHPCSRPACGSEPRDFCISLSEVRKEDGLHG